MWQRIRHLFTPPTLADEETTRRARLLNVIVWTMIFAILLLIVLFHD